MSTPKTWAANTEPTPEQLAVWLQDATHEERVQHASKVLDLSARAHDCLTRNHEGLLEERNHWIGEAHRFKRLYQASDKDAMRWFKRMKVAEAALDAAGADLSASQDHDGTEGHWTHGDGRNCRLQPDGLWYVGGGIQCLRDHERNG